jgi:hypothetical protein
MGLPFGVERSHQLAHQLAQHQLAPGALGIIKQ